MVFDVQHNRLGVKYFRTFNSLRSCILKAESHPHEFRWNSISEEFDCCLIPCILDWPEQQFKKDKTHLRIRNCHNGNILFSRDPREAKVSQQIGTTELQI